MILITHTATYPEKLKLVRSPASGEVPDSGPVEDFPAAEFPVICGHPLALRDSRTTAYSGASFSPLFINSTRSYSDE